MTDLSNAPINDLLSEFKIGNPLAIEKLWNDYFNRLVGLARRQLQNRPQLIDHDEDAALSAFKSFIRRTREGHFEELADREGIWSQLAVLTRQKVIDLRRRESAKKRGGGKVLRESELTGREGQPASFAAQVSDEPDPAFAAAMSEQCRSLLERLEDETLREIVILRMSLYTNQEIADRFGKSLSWVHRKIEAIRRVWSRGARS